MNRSDKRLLLPQVWVETRELVSGLLYPNHFFLDVDPVAFLERHGGGQLRAVVGHVVEDVEQNRVRKRLDVFVW